MIRVARASDLPEIAVIHAEGWHNAYGALMPEHILRSTTGQSMLEQWQRWFASPSDDVHLLIEDDRIAGFVHTCNPRPIQSPPADFGELYHLYLAPSLIGSGAGHQLFQFAIEHLKRCGYVGMLLWTLDGNAKAQLFYERQGMVLDGARRDDPTWLGDGVYEVRYRLAF